jgi:hypothetical protein
LGIPPPFRVVDQLDKSLTGPLLRQLRERLGIDLGERVATDFGRAEADHLGRIGGGHQLVGFALDGGKWDGCRKSPMMTIHCRRAPPSVDPGCRLAPVGEASKGKPSTAGPVSEVKGTALDLFRRR